MLFLQDLKHQLEVQLQVVLQNTRLMQDKDVMIMDGQIQMLMH